MHKLIVVLSLLLAGTANAELHKVQILLANPRSVSTAFEKSMIARRDHKTFHEPWLVSLMYNQGRHSYFSQMPPKEIIETKNYNDVKQLIYHHASLKPVFIKDMVWSMKDELLQDEDFLSDRHVIFTFLIRDPGHSIESFFLKGTESAAPDEVVEFTQEVFRFDAIVQIAEKHRQLRGEWPIIIEAEDLCRDPQTAMSFFCRQAGINYMSESLKWDEGMPEEWKHFASWHEEAATSHGFFVPKRDASNTMFSQIPDQYVPALEKIYLEQKPFYEKLKTMKRA